MTAAQEPLEPRGPAEELVDPVGPDEPVDPVDPDEVAEEAPIDPTPQEVDEYRALIGDETPEPGVSRDPDAASGSERTAGSGGSRGRAPEIPEF